MNPTGSGRRIVAAVLLLLHSVLPCWAFSPGVLAKIGGFRQTTQTPSLCNYSNTWQNYRSSSKTVLMAKKTQPAPLPTSDDPFLLLGLDSPTTDKQEIKRAYRKRAMQYHPDVLLDQDSTEAEREEASKNFARINAAYEMLTGGTKGNASSDSSGASAKTTSGGYNYQPPHRRSSSYSSSSSTRSTNWEDYMPNYSEEDEKYDAGGDSFGAIFSDLLTGAAGAAAGVAGSYSGGGGSGIFGDFIEFLEGNIDGFESGYDDDRSLSELLNYGSFDDIANEMDETDVLVTSLETKQQSVENDLMQVQADLNVATKFSEKLDLEERIAELKARDKVVKGYLKKGRNRLIRLRERYKELMVKGRGGRGYGSSSSSSGSSTSSSSYSSSSTGSSSSYRASNTSTPPPPSPPPPAPSSSASSDKNWRTEGFSSSYGRSSSGRRSSRGNRRRSARVDEPSESTATTQQQQQQRSASETYNSNSNTANSSTNRSSSSSTSSPPKQYEPWVPPHRRTTSSAESAAKDKKRLRELQVDDEFEKLKREMGM